MGQRIQTVQPQSQATPFAQDFLAHLQGLLDNEGTGRGPTGLQQESGTAIRQWLQEMGDFDQFAAPIEAVHGRQMGRQAADLREMFGAQGQRFGSQLGRAETDLRLEGLENLSAMMGGLRMQQGQQQLQGIGLMNQIGQANMMPFLAMAQQGIMPEQIMASPNPWLQLGTAGLGGLSQFMMPWAQARAGM